MLTYADLFLKAIQLLTGERTRQIAAKRDQLDRVAAYLERISAALKEAADTFSTSRTPWAQSREMAHQVDNFLSVVGESFEEPSFVVELKTELQRAVSSDYRMLGISDQHLIADGIVIRPAGYEYRSWKDNPLIPMSPKEVENLLADEVRKLEEASGLFRAASHKLRAAAT